MKLRIMKLAVAAVLLAACGSEPAANRNTSAPEADPAPPVVVADSEVPDPGPVQAAPERRPELLGERVVRAEWATAPNRGSCAPLAFADDGGVGGKLRRAEFSGGWAVAFDLPGRRSAYGVAGPGLIPADDPPADAQRRRIGEQWPYFRDLGQLPRPAFAGYGVVGAQPYPEGRPDGAGLHSLAYVRVEGQACTYNIWSRIGRAHLELLLDSLRLLPPA